MKQAVKASAGVQNTLHVVMHSQGLAKQVQCCMQQLFRSEFAPHYILHTCSACTVTLAPGTVDSISF